MSHPNQIQFCNTVKYLFPQYFVEKKMVIDVGSLDVNGNNRGLFEECDYVGVDVIQGANVDLVCIAHKLNIPDNTFDVVLSTNAMEHDMYYEKTLAKMVSVLRPNGLMFFSVANSWGEHGTTDHDANHSGTTMVEWAEDEAEWKNYYKNLTEEDVRAAIDLDKEFLFYRIGVNGPDLQFYGVKKGEGIAPVTVKYGEKISPSPVQYTDTAASPLSLRTRGWLLRSSTYDRRHGRTLPLAAFVSHHSSSNSRHQRLRPALD